MSEARKQPREAEAHGDGAADLWRRCAGHFERAPGFWELMRKRIAASQYNRARGDSACGLIAGVSAEWDYIRNVSMRCRWEGDLEAAKVLAFSHEELSAGPCGGVEKATLELTAESSSPLPGTGAGAEDGVADPRRAGPAQYKVWRPRRWSGMRFRVFFNRGGIWSGVGGDGAGGELRVLAGSW